MSDWREDPYGRYAERLFVVDGPTEVVRIGDLELRDPLGAGPNVAASDDVNDLDGEIETPGRRGTWSAALVVVIVAAAISVGAYLSNHHSSRAAVASTRVAAAASGTTPTLQDWANGPGPRAMSRVDNDFSEISNDDVAGERGAAEQLCAVSLEDLDALNNTLPVANSDLNTDLKNAISFARTSLTDCENDDLSDEQSNSNEATRYLRAAEPLIGATG